VYVEADLPGFRKEDVNIAIEDGTLTITAERKEEIEEPAAQAQQGKQGQRNQSQQAQAAQGQAGQQGQSQQQAAQQKDDSNYLLRERRVMRFVRSFTLPPNVDDSQVQAKLENGVLKITLNKREESKPKRIQVS